MTKSAVWCIATSSIHDEILNSLFIYLFYVRIIPLFYPFYSLKVEKTKVFSSM